MPQRKIRKEVSRRQPTVPKGDEGANMDKEIKAEKLKMLLADFDTHMHSWYKSIHESVRDYEKLIEYSYTLALQKIPKSVREMDLEDCLMANKESCTSLICNKVSKQVDMSLGTDMALAKLTKVKNKPRKRCRRSTLARRSRSTIKPQKKKKNDTSINESMPPPPITRTTMRMRKAGQLETPAHRFGPSQLGWETPMITPKFDPRLPVTPAMTRQPKKGEISISLAGSPIINEVGRNTIIVKKDPKQGKTLLILDDEEVDLEQMDMSHIEMNTKEYLKLLKKKLNAIKFSPTAS